MKRKNNTITAKKHQEFIAALQDSESWSPNFTKISSRIQVSISTIFDWYKKLNNRDMVACHVKVDVFNEPKVVQEQYEKWQEINGKPAIMK